MTSGDLRFAADLQRAYLSDGFFASLGPGFMRAYLATFLDSRVSVALLAERGGQAVGFLVGSFDHTAHVQMTVRRHGPRLVVFGVVAMLVRPAVGWRFARTRARRYAARVGRTLGRGSTPTASRHELAAAGGLGHLVVVPEGRGLGIGSALTVEYMRRVQAYGVTRAQLTTKAGEAGAGAFYERLGWVSTLSFDDPDGVAWTRYQLDL